MTKPTVTVIDTGISNVGSVANLCRKLDASVDVTDDPDTVASAPMAILPGVGSFDTAMERLDASGLGEAICAAAAAGHVLLGICLGMQILFDASDEGERSGLGLLPGRVTRLPAETIEGRLPIPHMGWNRIDATLGTGVLEYVEPASRFYFVHSYAAVPDDAADVLARTTYGSSFVSMVQRDGVIGAQFHPEKSHRHGRALMQGFLAMGA